MNKRDAEIITQCFDMNERNGDIVEVEEILKCICINLGLKQVGYINSIVEYDPIEHKDIEGGLLPGDKVRIVKIRWRYLPKLNEKLWKVNEGFIYEKEGIVHKAQVKGEKEC